MEKKKPQKTFSGFVPVKLEKTSHAYTGLIYVSIDTYEELKAINGKKEPVYIKVGNYLFKVMGDGSYANGQMGLNKMFRQFLKVSLTDTISFTNFIIPVDQEFRLSNLAIEVELEQAQSKKISIDTKDFEQIIKQSFKEVVFMPGMLFFVDYNGNLLNFKVIRTQLLHMGTEQQSQIVNQPGVISEHSDFEFSVSPASAKFLNFIGSERVQNLFRADFKFEDMGIGGLDKELCNIFRRAFASRRFPPAVLKRYGITHVKGVLLFGPPGTGKTLIARKLSQALRSKEPKVVNGPEIMSKYVGESEKNIRELFAEAIEDSKQGDESQLHIIIFDEIDAICKQRGTVHSGTGVHDSIVNQLLSMIDGVDSLNNILVIGMTNRKDLIDEALLRPGRFEVQVEITLPDEKGRFDIFKIHTTEMSKSKVLSDDVSLERLANVTKNYTGAEIEAVVKSAASFLFNRSNDLLDFSKKAVLREDSKVEMRDFNQALEEVKPQFGVDTDKFELLVRNELIDYGENHRKIIQTLKQGIDQVKVGKSSQLHSILLEGDRGTGKTAIAAWAALNCDFPFVKLISPENFVGYSEQGKITTLVKIFEDAYRSPQACIVLDNIERIIEYIDIGPRFSNPILQAVLVLIKKMPMKVTHKLLIIGTTNSARVLKTLEVLQAFNIVVNIPKLSTPKEIITFMNKYKTSLCNPKELEKIANDVKAIPVKKLLLIIDMVNRDEGITYEQFMACYDSAMQSEKAFD